MATVFPALASFLPHPLGLPLHNSGASFSTQDGRGQTQLFNSGTQIQTPAPLLTVGFYRQVT